MVEHQIRETQIQNQKMTTIKTKRISIKEGDIFTIPIDEHTQGYGQIVKMPNKYEFIMIVFEGKWPVEREIKLDNVVNQTVLFLGYTTDTLLNLGRWKIVGNSVLNLSSITMPYYKLAFPPETKLVNYKLDFVRMATPEEDKLLNFQSSRSPIGYQNMLQAHYGIGQCEEELKYNYKHIVNTMAKLNLLPN